MSAVLEVAEPAVRLARIQAELRALQDSDLTALGDEHLLDLGRELERTRRLLPPLEHRFITEVEGRGIPQARFVRLVPLLRSLLRLHPHEASARVAAAHAAAPRRGLTGEPLPAAYPQVAAGQQAGGISERHAKVIVECIEKLPEAVRFEHGVDDVDDREKTRELVVHQRPDGSVSGKFEGSAEFGEFLLLSFDAFGAPKPAVDGVKDPRSAGQRRHDALLEALKLNVRARQLPSVAGVTATVVLTMTAEQFQQRKGLARTAHGALVPVPEAMRMTGGEYRLMNVVLDKTKGITAYSSTARLFPEGARLAMIAADGGCSFPNCPAPPAWCQIDCNAMSARAKSPPPRDRRALADRAGRRDLRSDERPQAFRSCDAADEHSRLDPATLDRPRPETPLQPPPRHRPPPPEAGMSPCAAENAAHRPGCGTPLVSPSENSGGGTREG